MNNGSALWTDGRYFLQADMELDCNWILQKAGRCFQTGLQHCTNIPQGVALIRAVRPMAAKLSCQLPPVWFENVYSFYSIVHINGTLYIHVPSI